MATVRVGDRVLFEGKTWRVDSLGQHAYRREDTQTIVNGELYATLSLELDPSGSQLPRKVIVPESHWDEVRLLEE